MNAPGLVDIAFLGLVSVGLVLGGYAIFWKWRYEKHFDRRVVHGEECLWVRCVPSELRAFSTRLFLFFIMPLVCVGGLVWILMHPESPLFLMFLLAYLLFAEILVIIMQVILLGQVMQIGSQGVTYPVTAQRGIFRVNNRNYSKLKSMAFAVVRNKKVTAPSQSVLAWEWMESKDQLTLTLNCRGLLKPKPKRLSFIVPRLSESELREMLSLLDGMNRE